MSSVSEHYPKGHALTRRDFLWLATVSSVGFVSGCATNPVTGESQLMLMSQADEIRADRMNSPHQFSADYGTVQSGRVNRYISGVGKKLAVNTHRPNMP